LGIFFVVTMTAKTTKSNVETDVKLVTKGVKRHTKNQQVSRDRFKQRVLTNRSTKRLAYRAGIKFVGHGLYGYSRNVLSKYLENIIHDCLVYMDYNKRTTVDIRDVEESFKRLHGKTLVRVTES
jgi:histone H3/H4